MDILGIGGWELVAILIIMLVVAGPKRMIQWSYTLGKYIAMLRNMWAETAVMLQKELDDAGVDVKVPNQLPTRGNIQREVSRAFSTVTKPVQDVMDEVKSEVEPIRQATTMPRTLYKPVSGTMPEPPAPPPLPSAPLSTPEAQNGHAPQADAAETDYGTWTEPPKA